MRQLIDVRVRTGVVAVMVGLSLAGTALARPPAPARPGGTRGATEEIEAPDADEDPARDGDEAPEDPAAAERGRGDDDAKAAPKRRPGVKQAEEPNRIDEELEDPEAARRAQFFGGMPGLPIPGMALPGFPGRAFPFVPPGAAAEGLPGFGAGQQFGFSGTIVVGGGNALPGGNGFVVRTWQMGPDGALVEVPPQPQAPAEIAERRRKPKGAVERGARNAKDGAGAAAAKAGRQPRVKQGNRAPREAAEGE